MYSSELVSLHFESLSKEAQTVLEELLIVLLLVHTLLHIADQVLKEGPDHYVNDLNNLLLNQWLNTCILVERLELLATSNIFLCRSDVKLI